MSTKKAVRKAAEVIAPAAATVSEEIALVDAKAFALEATRSGSPLLKGAIESRLYENDRVNGTTLIVIAALAASESEKGKKVFGLFEFDKGIKALTAKGSAFWTRLENNWNRGDNRSASPAKKIGPVLTGLKREIKNGYIKGFDASGIADEATRKVFGFDF